MAVSPEYRAYLEEMFQPIPGVRFKRMFGGLGVFRDDVMFGLVAYERLYFKVDDETKPRFAEAGVSVAHCPRSRVVIVERMSGRAIE